MPELIMPQLMMPQLMMRESIMSELNTVAEQYNPPSIANWQLENQNRLLKRELLRLQGQKRSDLEERSKVSERLKTLLELLPGGFVVLDRNGIITECNVAAVELLGKPLAGERWVTVIERSFSPRSDDGHEISLKDGRRVSIATRSMSDGEGQIILLTDQTETRQLQAKLSRNQRLTAMGQMVSALAHQIRTPLSAAMLYAGHLCRGGLDETLNRRFAMKLMSRLNHMEEQIRDMLVFAKGDLPLTDKVSVEELVDDINQAMEVPLLSGSCRCHWRLPEQIAALKSYSLFCNRQALVGAVINLVNNGIQAGVGDEREGNEPASLTLSVSITEKDQEPMLALAVADQGRGMDAKQLKAVEEAFYSTKAEGTGLGLYVVQAIARSHRGSFTIQSQLGKGTVATLLLPCRLVV